MNETEWYFSFVIERRWLQKLCGRTSKLISGTSVLINSGQQRKTFGFWSISRPWTKMMHQFSYQGIHPSVSQSESELKASLKNDLRTTYAFCTNQILRLIRFDLQSVSIACFEIIVQNKFSVEEFFRTWSFPRIEIHLQLLNCVLTVPSGILSG